MKPQIYHVANIGAGYLAVMAKPVAGEWIDDEFSGIAEFGIHTVVSLLQATEAYEVGLQQEQQYADKYAMDFISYPIADRGLPDSLTRFSELTARLYQQISEGNNTLIHCRGGIGRTGMVAAGILMHAGFKPEAAFELISRKRGVQVPDTRAQSEWVLSNHAAILHR